MRVFRYDRKRNSLVLQSIIMIVVAATMFYAYSHTSQIIYFALFALGIGFLAIYFYRMFIMRVLFDDNCVRFKGLAKEYTIQNKEVFDIQILKLAEGKVSTIKYTKDLDNMFFSPKSYVIIRANDTPIPTNLSMFSAANANYISLEYVPEMRSCLNRILVTEQTAV